MRKVKFMLLSIMAVFMASCTHDFEYMDYAEQVTAQYNAAFVKSFGTPSPTQTWGFDNVAASRSTRAIENKGGFEFPNDADASKFLSEVPASVPQLTQNNASVNNWIDENWSGDINIWGQGTAENGWKAYGGTLYIKGNCDFSNRNFYFAGNGAELYLVAGSTLTLSASNAANLQEGTMIYVAEGAKIVANGELKLNKGLHIYNHGTIEAEQISTNSESVLYNVGTIKVNGKISVENTLSVFVNDGTLTAKELNTAGSGKVQNNGDATIEGETTINSNSNTWVNNGQYTTGDFKYTAGSTDVKNNCKLTVKNQFYINLGDCDYGIGFYVNGGVVASSFTMEGPGYIYLASNSVFKVDGTATMNITKANYGIYGNGSDWAVFQADEIVAGAANQEYLVTYGGKLAVVTNSHFAQSTVGRPYYEVKDDAVLYVGGETPNITIEETECNPGFVGNTTTTPPTEDEPTEDEPTNDVTYIGLIVAEDLSVSTNTDFDFNDVVFAVGYDKNDATYVKILAAGGTLPLYVASQEVHAVLGVGQGEMVNTGEKEVEPVELKISDTKLVPSEIQVTVLKNGTVLPLLAPKGEPAAKIFIPDTEFKWCDERKDINDVYPMFKKWVNGEVSEDTEWWK